MNLLLLSFCASFSAALVLTSVERSVGAHLSRIGTFRFAGDGQGTYEVRVEPLSGRALGFALLCASDEYSEWRHVYAERELACEAGARLRTRCLASVFLRAAANGSDVLLSGRVASAVGGGVGVVSVVLLVQRCATASVDDAWSVRVTATMLNGESQLDAEDVAVPLTLLCVAGVYGALVFAWFVVWRAHAFRLAHLHAALTVALVCKSVALGVAVWYWSAQARSGTHGRLELACVLLAGLLQRAAQFALLFLIAKGFGVTRRTLLRSEWRAVATMTAVMAGALLAFDLDDSDAVGDLVSFARLSAKGAGFASAIIAAKYVHTDLKRIVGVLGLHVLFSRMDGGQRTALVLARLTLVYALRLVLFSYFAVFVVVHIIVLLSLDELDWYERLMVEIVELLLYAALMWLLRLRPPVARTVGRAPQDDGGAAEAAVERVDDFFVLQLPPLLEKGVERRTWTAAPHVVVASDGPLASRLVERRQQQQQRAEQHQQQQH